MKKLLVVFILAALLIAAPSFAAVKVLNVAATTVTSASYDLTKADKVSIQIVGATATATVVIEQQISASAGWMIVATITNPSASGEIWATSAPEGLVHVRVSAISGGTVSAWISAEGRNSTIY